MKIEKRCVSGEQLLSHMLDMHPEWDRTFEFESHLYIVLVSGNSSHTRLNIDRGYIPIFNLKSRTVRAIPSDTVVLPRECTVYSGPFK